MKPLVGLLALLVASNGLAQFGVPGGGYSNVRFGMLGQGTDATTGAAGLFTFNEPIAWQNYWRANHRGPGPALSPGFFQQWRLVAIHAGNRPGEGYNLGVMRITRRIDRATISAVETVPPPRRGIRSEGNRGRVATTTSPWILLQVERGAFDFDLQTQQVAGYGSSVSGANGSSVRVGNGVTATFGPGW